MFTKQLLIGVLATFLTFGLFGVALADQNPNDEAGKWQYSFATAEKSHMHAMTDVVSRDALVGIDEKGLSDYRFDSPETKADIAAKTHVYNPTQLVPGGLDYVGQFNNGVSLKCNGC